MEVPHEATRVGLVVLLALATLGAQAPPGVQKELLKNSGFANSWLRELVASRTR
jgi:hypothetical protein